MDKAFKKLTFRSILESAITTPVNSGHKRSPSNFPNLFDLDDDSTNFRLVSR